MRAGRHVATRNPMDPCLTALVGYWVHPSRMWWRAHVLPGAPGQRSRGRRRRPATRERPRGVGLGGVSVGRRDPRPGGQGGAGAGVGGSAGFVILWFDFFRRHDSSGGRHPKSCPRGRRQSSRIGVAPRFPLEHPSGPQGTRDEHVVPLPGPGWIARSICRAGGDGSTIGISTTTDNQMH